MTAITKSWTSIADGAIDPDSPITTGLMTALRDNDVYLREWLGASFTGGAVQDHNHDGANSSLIEVGPNLLRNGSFETGTAGWTLTMYSGGSYSVSSSGNRHGGYALSITSSVLVNGGGYATSGFMAVAPTEVYLFKGWVVATAANVSCSIKIDWYNLAQSLISSSTLYSSSSTPTSVTHAKAQATAPSNAVYAKLVVTGGVPGTGSAVGTVRFDGLTLSDWSIDQTLQIAGSVGQAQLKTASGTVSTTSSSEVHLTLPGGAFGFHPQLRTSTGGSVTSKHAQVWTSSTSATAVITLSTTTGTAYADQTYVQASPPYDLGDGDIPAFVFLAVDSAGRAVHCWAAEDPPWANNGPTNSRADYYRGGVGYQRVRDLSDYSDDEIEAMRWDDYAAALHEAPIIERVVTQRLKQADMAVIPHPFGGNDLDGLRVVLIDPVSALCGQLAELQRGGERLHELFLGRDLLIDNEPLTRAAPPGVLPVRAAWKESRR